MLEPREFGDTPRRDALIRKLMAKYNVTHRMVVRCLDEWLPTRWNRKMYRSATEGAIRGGVFLWAAPRARETEAQSKTEQCVGER
jgi:hypothetical protein